MHILVVEDEKATADLLLECLQAWGHDAVCAGDGAAAKQMLSRGTGFDLLLLDLFLPDGLGHHMLPAFRALQPELPVVTMTGSNTRELELQVRQQGILYYMSKPFELMELKRLLDHVGRNSALAASDV
ncbi:MAG: response regulator [Deltaproteobacteria bacterium]|nr:response regulator [Deltaproteobacteria bacterium]